MKLTEQLTDWKEIKRICDVVNVAKGSYRKSIVVELEEKVKDYCQAYQTKFDLFNPPK